MGLKKILASCLVFLPFILSAQTKAFEINRQLGRGINFGNMFEAPSEGEWSVTWQPGYSKIISDLGFNHVRIPIRWEPASRSLATSPYTVYPSFLNRIKQVVDSALANKLFAVINMHHHEALYESPDLQKTRFLTQWSQISDFFKDYPDSLVFEILNEPHGNLSADKWNTMAAEAMQVIRQKNPNRIVLIGVAEYGGLGGLSKLQLPSDTNLIVTIHYYNPFHFTHQGAEWSGEQSNSWLGTKWNDTDEERAVMQQEFAPLLRFSQNHNIPVHIGEFGAYSKADMVSRAKWTTYLSRYFESLGWSWAYWEFCAGFGIYNPDSKTYNQPLVDALLHNPMPEAAHYKVTPIYASNFTTGNDGWNLYKQGTADATMSRVTSQLFIQINNGSTETWHVQIVKSPFALSAGKKYKVSFKAKTTGPRTIVGYAGKNSDPWTGYSNYDSFTLNDTLKEYFFIFDQTVTDPVSRLAFNLGISAEDVTITDIKLAELSLTTSSVDILDEELKIYPNPATDKIFLPGQGKGKRVQIYSIAGAKVADIETGTDNSADISGLKPGLYIAVLETNQGILKTKLAKQ